MPRELHPENLVPLTTEKARQIGRKGGTKSGIAKREKKLMSTTLAEWMAAEHGISIDGEMKKLSGAELVRRVATKIIIEGSPTSVQMMRLILDATEGAKSQVTGADGAPLPTEITIRVIKPDGTIDT